MPAVTQGGEGGKPAVGGLRLLAAALVAGSLAAQVAPAAAQETSGGDGGETFLASVLPDFVKGWFGLDQGSQSSGSGQSSGGQSGGGGQQAPAVVAAKAELQSVGERYEFIGRIEAIQKVTVQARVSGFIQEVFFEGGDSIKAGDKLFQIEPDQYQASLQAAEAQRASSKAAEDQARRSLQRNQELARNGTVSQAQRDDARATFEQTRGARLQAEAQVRQAKLALDYTSIVAPIDGQISEPLITKGNYVTVSSGALANLIQENPIWGTFPIGENRLATWRRFGIDGKTPSDDAGQAAGFDLSLILPNEQEYSQSGNFSFISNTVDPQTGTVMVRVEFPNENGILLPEENVTMVASEKNPPRQPVIPQAAVQLSREGRSVFVLADDDTVHRRPITVGKQLRGEVAVTKGLKGGEYVVVQGLQNIKDGVAVKPTFKDGSGPTPNDSTRDNKTPADKTAGRGSAGSDDWHGGGADRRRDNTAEQRVGTQSQSETRAAAKAGPSNKQTPVDPQPLSQPRSQSENTGGKPSSDASGNGA